MNEGVDLEQTLCKYHKLLCTYSNGNLPLGWFETGLCDYLCIHRNNWLIKLYIYSSKQITNIVATLEHLRGEVGEAQ